jgi:hypothetical protein
VGRRVKVATKSLGDITPLDVSMPPSDVVRVAYTCTGGSAASIAQLWYARYYCIAGGTDFSKPRFNAVCGANGICSPQ